MEVERWDADRWGPLSEEGLRRRLEAAGYSVQRYVYSPGTCFPDHEHPMDKVDAVLAGRFRIRMNGADILLEAGDTVDVPAGTVHSAEVVGDQPVVSLDACKT